MGENEEFASCHILRFRNIKRANAPLSLIQFHGFVPNQVVVVVLQILSIMGGGVEENTLTIATVNEIGCLSEKSSFARYF